MTKRTRRNHLPDFKAKVALAALEGGPTIAQLSDQASIHVGQISAWKERKRRPTPSFRIVSDGSLLPSHERSI